MNGIVKASTIDAPSAIESAIMEALVPLDVQDIDMPLRPLGGPNAIQPANSA